MDVSFTDMGVQLWEHLKVLETVGFANVLLKVLGLVQLKNVTPDNNLTQTPSGESPHKIT